MKTDIEYFIEINIIDFAGDTGKVGPDQDYFLRRLRALDGFIKLVCQSKLDFKVKSDFTLRLIRIRKLLKGNVEYLDSLRP